MRSVNERYINISKNPIVMDVSLLGGRQLLLRQRKSIASVMQSISQNFHSSNIQLKPL